VHSDPERPLLWLGHLLHEPIHFTKKAQKEFDALPVEHRVLLLTKHRVISPRRTGRWGLMWKVEGESGMARSAEMAIDLGVEVKKDENKTIPCPDCGEFSGTQVGTWKVPCSDCWDDFVSDLRNK
jgi:hypothetical protein